MNIKTISFGVLFAIITSASNLMAGTWAYPVETEYVRCDDGSMAYFHTYPIYGTIHVITIDTGKHKGAQGVGDADYHLFASKDGPDYTQKINGLVYAVYNYDGDLIYHRGSEQAIYIR